MQKEGKMSQVKSGVRRAAAWLLGIGWLGLVFGGMAVALTPSPHSPILGWAMLAVAAWIFFEFMDRWVRVFPTLLAFGILNAFICIGTGHLTNNPTIPISRSEAIVQTLFFAGSFGLSRRFMHCKLRMLDRVALFAFVFCFFWSAADDSIWNDKKMSAVAEGIAFCSLLFAWAYDRWWRVASHEEPLPSRSP